MSAAVIDFSVGLTDPRSFPVEALASAAAGAIREVGEGFATYPGPLGHAGLRRLMAARESRREGIEISPEQVALTNGSMQAVTLVGRALMSAPDDPILTEEVTYSGTIKAYRGLGAQLVGVPVDEHGMRIDRLADLIERLRSQGRPPRFVYTLPTYQNPTGAVMPLERRRQLLEVARRYELPVVEDNCYGDVHYEGDVPPALFALDPSPRVIYIGSLSKIFGAGVRIGYLIARPPMLEHLVERRFDAGHSLLSASVAAACLEGSLWEHVERHNRALKRKRDALLVALDGSLRGRCRWRAPQGGIFLWLALPDGCDLDRLERLAAADGVLFARGARFDVEDRDIPYLRLAFGHLEPEEIERGVEVLASSIAAASATEAGRASG